MVELEDPWPPRYVSYPAAQFMMRRTEHREFNALYHELARRAINGARGKRKEIYGKYIDKRQYYLENFLCRIHDIFIQYYEEIAVEILWSKLHQSEEQDGEKRWAARETIERTVSSKAAKRISDFVSFVSTEGGQQVAINATEITLIATLGALRNLIVHNDGVPDARFLARVAETDFRFELQKGGRVEIEESWLLEGAQICDAMVFRFDQHVVEHFSLPARDRFGLFWIR
ncbi:MAG: hypothetical protein JWR51_2110 [Devosia sp.]|uniref:hypothetical protein n=1 Tax=Devosia sp. TaxID=1871048 RepID=UPI00262B2F71|nr:hypothetical protein [Devosia sp.]MDB5529007.1 hypothetical protein [Devosia sp.]